MINSNLQTGSLVRLKDTRFGEIFVVVKKLEQYKVPIYEVRSSATNREFRIAGDALIPLEVPDDS